MNRNASESLISVILPTRRRPQLLPRAVASVMAQTHSNFELIIVDDNEPEDRAETRAALAPWLGDRRLKLLLNDRRRNVATARNLGLDHAMGEWVTYLDDDDAYRPTKLERQVATAASTGAPLVVCGACFHLRGRTREVQIGCDEWKGEDLLFRARWNTPLLLHPRLAGARFCADLSNGEDVEFALRSLHQTGWNRVPVVADALVDIYPQPGPRVNTDTVGQWRTARKVLRMYGRALNVRERHRYLLQVLLSREKLRGQLGSATLLAVRLFFASGGADWRMCANAVLMASGWQRGRWVN
ncbi:hypothetical protein MASR2M8_25450 [Opitutaceae bacterium]